MVEQVRTRRVKMSTVARNPAFRAGIRDFTKGTTPAFDQVYSQARGQSVTDSAWAYERGRLFAAWTKGAGRRAQGAGQTNKGAGRKVPKAQGKDKTCVPLAFCYPIISLN